MDNTARFTTRVTSYVASRPTYPPQILSLLDDQFHLPAGATIVDLGSGTGILTAQLLEHFKDKRIKVVGLEPNEAMRKAAEEALATQMRNGYFVSLNKTSEATGLQDRSVDLVIAGQAFHWFDEEKTRQECLRILKPEGGVALLYNDRRGKVSKEVERLMPSNQRRSIDPSSFMAEYDDLLSRHRADHFAVYSKHHVSESILRRFFGHEGFQVASFPNPYQLTSEQLQARVLSSSYAPEEGHEGHEEMLVDLRALFEKYQVNGTVEYFYDARVFYGAMS